MLDILSLQKLNEETEIAEDDWGCMTSAISVADCVDSDD